MKTLRFLLCAGFACCITACTTVRLADGSRLITPAEMKNVTFTASSFHADEVSHKGVYQLAQQLGTMLGVGAFLP